MASTQLPGGEAGQDPLTSISLTYHSSFITNCWPSLHPSMHQIHPLLCIFPTAVPVKTSSAPVCTFTARISRVSVFFPAFWCSNLISSPSAAWHRLQRESRLLIFPVLPTASVSGSFSSPCLSPLCSVLQPHWASFSSQTPHALFCLSVFPHVISLLDVFPVLSPSCPHFPFPYRFVFLSYFPMTSLPQDWNLHSPRLTQRLIII